MQVSLTKRAWETSHWSETFLQCKRMWRLQGGLLVAAVRSDAGGHADTPAGREATAPGLRFSRFSTRWWWTTTMSCSEQSIFHGQASDRVWFFSELLFQRKKSQIWIELWENSANEFEKPRRRCAHGLKTHLEPDLDYQLRRSHTTLWQSHSPLFLIWISTVKP